MKRILILAALVLAVVVSFAADSALVSIPVACLRGDRASGAELVSQALLGTPLRILGREGEWYEVETPDGYRGFMTASSLVERDLAGWRASRRAVVTELPGAVLVDERGAVMSPLPAGAIVELSQGGVLLPDGRRGFMAPDGLTDLDKWGSQPFSAAKLVATARALSGAPYLWGGMSPWAMDCSGLVRIAYWMQGRLLPRDASQQALVGEEVTSADIRPGDLLFLDRTGSGRVNHVAICSAPGRLIHCSGYVRENALDPPAPDALTGTRLGVRRTEGSPALPLLK